MLGASSGMTMVAPIPARAAYVAQAAPALPLVGIAIRSTPSSRARVTPTAAPRALNEPVGISPSSLTIRSGDADLGAVRRGAQQRRPALAQRGDVPRVGDRQQLPVAPQVGRAQPANRSGVTAFATAGQVVAGQQRRPALAEVL